MPKMSPVTMADLTQDEKAYLGSDLKTEAVIARCIDLLAESGHSPRSEWTDASLTSTNEKHCLTVIVDDGAFHGHGSTKNAAAISCFKILWHHFVVIPSAPAPNPTELELKKSGNRLAALRAYMDRTEESLGIARSRLEI